MNVRPPTSAGNARPILDGAYLEAQTLGDAALCGELLRLFVEQCRVLMPVILSDVEPRLRAGTPAQADAAHTLRGGALAIGAGRVAWAAGEIERQAREGRVEPALRDGLERAVAELSATIAHRLGTGPRGGGPA